MCSLCLVVANDKEMKSEKIEISLTGMASIVRRYGTYVVNSTLTASIVLAIVLRNTTLCRRTVGLIASRLTKHALTAAAGALGMRAPHEAGEEERKLAIAAGNVSWVKTHSGRRKEATSLFDALPGVPSISNQTTQTLRQSTTHRITASAVSYHHIRFHLGSTGI